MTWKTLHLYLASLSVIVSLGIMTISQWQTQVKAQSKPVSQTVVIESRQQIFFKPPEGDGAPEGGTAPGGTRSPCAKAEPHLTLLLPTTTNRNGMTVYWEGLTVDSHPTFFVYIPETSARTAEFTLRNEDHSYTYNQIFTLPNRSGIVSVKLPDDRPSLEVNENYLWQVSIICNPEDRREDILAQGRSQRIEVPEQLATKLAQARTPLERAAVYGEAGIWHETLTNLAFQWRSQLENPKFAAIWQQLLESESVKLDAIAEQRLVECCTLDREIK